MDSSVIATFLNKQLFGSNIEVTKFSSLSELNDNCVVFCKKYSVDLARVLNEHKVILAIVTPEYEGKIDCSYIISENPRLDYLRVLKKFFNENKKEQGIHATAVVEEGAQLGLDVFIGANCYIGRDVIIGDNTYISPNVVIDGKTIIGNNCYFKSGSVIGQTGFGFERNADGIPEYFPHFGTIEIGNNVHIGANNTIDRGTLGVTKIGDNVKTDNLVHIAHNDTIGESSLITAGVIFSGGVIVGKQCWIAPNVCVKEKTVIGDKGYIGIGAVVIKSVNAETIVVGNPAKQLMK